LANSLDQNLQLPSLPAAATLSAASVSSTTVTYTGANTFVAGQIVDVQGFTVASGLSLNSFSLLFMCSDKNQCGNPDKNR
jgi:hypothetical protein